MLSFTQSSLNMEYFVYFSFYEELQWMCLCVNPGLILRILKDFAPFLRQTHSTLEESSSIGGNLTSGNWSNSRENTFPGE